MPQIKSTESDELSFSTFVITNSYDKCNEGRGLERIPVLMDKQGSVRRITGFLLIIALFQDWLEIQVCNMQSIYEGCVKNRLPVVALE